MKVFFKFGLIFLIFLLASACAHNSYNKKISIAGKILKVEVASTPAQMEQGLSGRESMKEDEGMLFDFGENASVTPAFWMKDMKFSLDFIWIKNGKVIGTTPNVPTLISNLKLEIKNLPVYYPPSPVDSVLEVNAEWAKNNNIKIGETVRIP